MSGDEFDRAELERKYTSALANLYAEYERGDISKETFITAFNAVYTSVSGLVNWDDLNGFASEVRKIEKA